MNTERKMKSSDECTAPHGLDRYVRVTDRIPGPGKG
jgi:hypothetical protein